MSQPTGKKVYYLESPVTGWAQMPYNTKEVLTESGEWESPITGWVRVTCIGGGQSGATLGTGHGGAFSGWPGAATSFASIYARGGGHIGKSAGGAAGEVVVDFLLVQKGESYDYVIGTGGQAQAHEPTFADTCPTYNGGNFYTVARVPSTEANWAIQGGTGGSNGTPYGGGGGAGGMSTNGEMGGAAGGPGAGAGGPGTSGSYGMGGFGGNGAIILEYADPQKKA